MIYVCFRDTVKVYENCNNLYTLGPVIIHNFGPFSSQKSQNTYKYSKKCNNGLWAPFALISTLTGFMAHKWVLTCYQYH